MNGFTAHQPPKAGLVFLNLAIGLPCEIFLQISQGEFVFWCLLFGISTVCYNQSAKSDDWFFTDIKAGCLISV